MHRISSWSWPTSCHNLFLRFKKSWVSVGLCLVSGLIPECGVEQKLLGENRVLWVLLVLVHSSETTDCCFVLWYCIDPWRRNRGPRPTTLHREVRVKNQNNSKPVKESLTCSRTLQQGGCLLKVSQLKEWLSVLACYFSAKGGTSYLCVCVCVLI